MIFNHIETGRSALWITPYDWDWKNQDDPNLYRIKKWWNLPEPKSYYTKLKLPPEIWENQGNKGLYYYFKALLQDNYPDKEASDFWFFLLPSGFPDGKIPE